MSTDIAINAAVVTTALPGIGASAAAGATFKNFRVTSLN